MAPPQNDPSSFPSGRRNENSAGTGGRSDDLNLSEEAAIYRTFMLIIRNKFVATPSSPSHEVNSRGLSSKGSSDSDSASAANTQMKRLDELYNSPSYDAEKRLLTSISNNGMVKGLCFGLGTFIFLRSGPRIMNKFLSRRLNNRSSSTGSNGNVGGGYQFDIRNAGADGFSQRMEPQIPRPGLFLRTFKFGLDIMLSVSAAMYGSVYFVDTKKLMREVSDIPLVSGRSAVSDELCDDFIDVYKAIPKKIWNKYDGRSESLDSISRFVKNCLRRQKVEKKIIEERQEFGSFGIDGDSELEDVHVPIPAPGVSPDIEIEIPWADKSEDIKVGIDPTDFLEGEQSFETEYDFDWDGEDTDADGRDNNDKEWK